MPVDWSSNILDISGRKYSPAPSSKRFSTLVYRSKAAAPFDESALHGLLQSAQARNRAESITGMLIHDDGTFFQWLEGPAASLARVWDSIRNDSRHTAIEILGEQKTPVRFFGDWDLKLAVQPLRSDTVPAGSLSASSQLLEQLYRRPQAAPQLLTTLAEPSSHSGPNGPRLVKALPWPVDARAAELASLLIAVDPDPALALIQQRQSQTGALAPLYATLFEPAARSLGDRWQQDDCSDLDVTLALSRLHSFVRCLGVGVSPAVSGRLPQYAVLVAPQPGEHHMLCAALASELFWCAGWNAQCEYPATDDALQRLVAGTWFDALDLSLSPAYRREDTLPRMERTIASVRGASRNKALAVVVSGRIFVEDDNACARVGADAGSPTSLLAGALILDALHKGNSAQGKNSVKQ